MEKRSRPVVDVSSAGFAGAIDVRTTPPRVTGGGYRGERRRSPRR